MCRATRGSRQRSIWTWITSLSSPRRSFSITSERRVEQKPYFITTPIFYPNSDPHLGHLYSTVLADIFARYSRLKAPSRPVLFVTGTDEHGKKIQKAARTNGFLGREQEFCDKISARFQDLAQMSGLSHTRFIRTTEPEHVAAVQHLWRELKSRGYLYKGTHIGWYSISDEAFYTNSQVMPVIHPTTRKQYMISRETRSIVQRSEEENYKFRLSDFKTLLLQRYATNPTAIVPREQHSLILQLLNIPDNVADLSVSRPSARLKWGIPVPDDPGHTIYVWLDALTAYLTAAGYPWTNRVQEKSSHNWPPDVQIIGKDILRFHAIYFPAFLMALNLPLPKTIISHAHITVDRKKMSKSVGNTANPFVILQQYEPDVVRYYLARIGGRHNADSDWAETQLRKFRRELISILGNVLSRAFAPWIVKRLPESEQYVSTKASIFASATTIADDVPGSFKKKHIHTSLENVTKLYQDRMDNLQISYALQAIADCLGQVNREFTAVAPWLESTNVDDASLLLSYTRETLRICGILMQPVIPSKAEALLDILGVPRDRRGLSDAQIGRGELPGDDQVPVLQVERLFAIAEFPDGTKRQKTSWMEF